MKQAQKSVLFPLAAVSFLALSLPARAPIAHAGVPAGVIQKRSETPQARPPAALERSKAVEQIHAFVDRAQSFQDVSLKVDSLVALAAMLWEGGGDAEYARQIFIDTHNFLKTFQPQEVNEAAAGAPPKGAPAPPSRRSLRLLR